MNVHVNDTHGVAQPLESNEFILKYKKNYEGKQCKNED